MPIGGAPAGEDLRLQPAQQAWFMSGQVRLRFRKSISRQTFQNTRKFHNDDFKYHIYVIYSVKQYIFTKKHVFFPHVIFFTLIYGPF